MPTPYITNGGRPKLATTVLFSKEPGTRSYVEGDTFNNPYDEIEALGGDAFFIEQEELKPKEDQEETAFWDGEVDDNAHLDIDLD